jgi:hypothetical protein
MGASSVFISAVLMTDQFLFYCNDRQNNPFQNEFIEVFLTGCLGVPLIKISGGLSTVSFGVTKRMSFQSLTRINATNSHLT